MFESAEMKNPKIGTVIVGIITIVITLLTTFLLTRIGRKTLLLVSLAGMMICCIVTGSVGIAMDDNTGKQVDKIKL